MGTARFSVLVETKGCTHPALSWDGDPPGGHHRKGVLRFKPLPEESKTIELRIDGVGGAPRGVFRWPPP